MERTCPTCGAANRIPENKLDRKARCGSCKTALPPLDRPIPLADAASFDRLIRESPLPVLVDFWADWCGPCHLVAPELEKLAKEKAGRVVVAKLNTEKVAPIAARFGIQSIPTMILFRGGKEQKRISGAMRAPAIASAFNL